MALSIVALADGQLPNAKGTLYAVPALTQAILKSITLVNTDTVDRTVNLYVNRTGTSRRIIGKDMTIGAGESLQFQTLVTLEAGDLVEGDASAAAVVDYTLNGVQNA